MASTLLADFTELVTPSDEDLLYLIHDPAGTPVSRKVKFKRFVTKDSNDDVTLTSATAITLASGTDTLTAAFTPITVSGTHTLDFASAFFRGLFADATVIFKQAGYIFGSLTLFVSQATIKNHTSLSGAVWGLATTYADANTWTADTNAVTLTSLTSFSGAPTFSVANSGTLTVTGMTGFASGGSIGSGVTVTTRTGFSVADAGGSGTLTTQIGIDIAALTKGGSNIGLRNASTLVNTPTVKAITATTDTVPATASTIRLNNTSGSSKTLASTPTIADGQDGQILVVFNSSANDVVLQDQGTLASSNLRLGAATRTLSQRDSIVLMYSSTVGDWIEIAFSNVL